MTPVLDRVIRLVDTVLAGVAVTAAAVMVLLVVAEVAARYVLSSSIIFANELARMMFVWTIFFGLPLALSRGRHVGILLIDRLLSGRVWRTVFAVTCFATAGLMAVVVFKSVDVMLFNWDQRLQSLPVSASFFYVPIPIGAACTGFYLIVMGLRGERVLLTPEEGLE